MGIGAKLSAAYRRDRHIAPADPDDGRLGRVHGDHAL